MSPSPEAFEHAGWTVRILVAWDQPSQRFEGRAELAQRGAMKCRINLPHGFQSREDAMTSLHRRALAFIDDWQQRTHDAESEFSEL